MKTAVLVLAAMVIAAVAAFARADDLRASPSCKYCGMDRQKFGYSRMLIECDDGTAVGTCSLHCAAVDLALAIDRAPKAIRVGDFGTKKLIDAEKASWVIGGGKLGVMTSRAKWAFERKEDAARFRREFGGSAAAFEEAVRLAYEDMYLDTKLIREKRKMKRAVMNHQHRK